MGTCGLERLLFLFRHIFSINQIAPLQNLKRPFYIGYLATAAPETSRFVHKVVGLIIIVLLGSGVIWTSIFADSTNGTFEYGVVKEWNGTIQLEPYPVLISNNRQFLIVAPFKHGAESLVKEYEGQSVAVHGSLIYRGGVNMIELADIQPDIASVSTSEPFSSRLWETEPQTLSGDIVDGKCWLGVMNPGEGLLHSACARLCLLGDIPPLFIVDGDVYVLVDQAGDAFKRESGKPSNGPATLITRLSLPRDGELRYAMVESLQVQSRD
jgi:hypothetical protein